MELIIGAYEAARTRLQNLVSKAVTNVETALDDQSLPAKDKFAISVKIIEMCSNYSSRLNENVKALRLFEELGW